MSGRGGFTAEQLEAIERRDGSLFVHANAGSGKTTVLVERFVRAVIDDGVGVDRILAITFTEKAAAELKARIRAALAARGERELARDSQRAWVSTIHGFCSRVLRTHALAAGVDPEYRVLAEHEARRLAHDAFELALGQFMDEAAGDGADRLELVAAYRPDGLEEMVGTVYSRLRSRGEREPELPPQEPPDPAELHAAREALEAAIAEALRRIGEIKDPGKRVLDQLARLGRCSELLARLGPDELPLPQELERCEPRPGNVRALREPWFDAAVEAHKAFAEACGRRREAAAYPLLRELMRLFGARYAELKRARSALDFEDLELVTRDLLRADPALREQYRARFEHVMVDEFQDTNRLQVELIGLVARRLFTVGDAFQSIYLFRNADVGIFRERRALAEEHGEAVKLATSFRSRREVLDALNAGFSRVFEGQGFEPLVAGRAEEPAGAPAIELIVVDRTRKRWDERLEGEEAPFGESLAHLSAWRAAEARLIAARLAELAGPGRRFRYGDAALLLRAGTDMAAYERALNDRGIPTYVAGGRGYYGQRQVGDLRAYLATLANPLDELSLYSLLASPIVGCSLDALALLALRARELPRDPWWALEEAFCGGDGSGGLADALPEADRERLARFVPSFAAERASAPRVSLEQLVERAITAFEYDVHVLALPDAQRRMANVRKLMRLAREFEAEEGRDLRRFIDFLAEQDAFRAREGEAPLEAEHVDAVRLMTVHAAKGLEFPLVVVADLGRTGREDQDELRVSADGRVGLRVASLGGGRQAGSAYEGIRQDQVEQADEEERRVFYVAMTRARDHLVVSGATDTEKWPEPRELGAPMDWIWRALAPDLPDAVAAGGRGEAVSEWEGRPVTVACTLCDAATVDEVLPAPDRAPAPPVQDARERAGAQPPLHAAVEAAGAPPVSRLSYSALEDYRRCGYRFYLERVLGLREAAPGEPEAPPAPVADAGGGPQRGGGLSPLLRGTIVHELLERLDFTRPAPPAREAVAQLVRAHGAEPTESAVAELRALVEAFATSPLCARLGARGARPRTELPFAFTLRPGGASGASVLVSGFMDVHSAFPDGSALVVDYKSDYLKGRDPEAVCAADYGTQRRVYALAALRAGAEPVEVAHVFLERPDAPAVAVYERADEPRLERELAALAADLLAGRFAPTDAPHRDLCATCPGRLSLCSWPPERTLADPPAAQLPSAQ
ncbi:MAG: UvrD-helicase domain-containing protein [Thermoleophilaceae bacterium]|nr:UvrD-helicase domain-containing protein [Thermoleophilaceae bacterium]